MITIYGNTYPDMIDVVIVWSHNFMGCKLVPKQVSATNLILSIITHVRNKVTGH